MAKKPSLQQLKDIIAQERGSECEHCNARKATQLHHCLLRRSSKHPEYDVRENLEWVCDTCHMSGELDTYEHGRIFWERQVARGYKMKEWYGSLNLRYREYYG